MCIWKWMHKNTKFWEKSCACHTWQCIKTWSYFTKMYFAKISTFFFSKQITNNLLFVYSLSFLLGREESLFSTGNLYDENDRFHWGMISSPAVPDLCVMPPALPKEPHSALPQDIHLLQVKHKSSGMCRKILSGLSRLVTRLSHYLLDTEQGQERWIVLKWLEKGFDCVQ